MFPHPFLLIITTIEMKTMKIKNKVGRVVEVEYKHGVALIQKEGAEIIMPKVKPVEKIITKTK